LLKLPNALVLTVRVETTVSAPTAEMHVPVRAAQPVARPAPVPVAQTATVAPIANAPIVEQLSPPRVRVPVEMPVRA